MELHTPRCYLRPHDELRISEHSPHRRGRTTHDWQPLAAGQVGKTKFSIVRSSARFLREPWCLPSP